MLMRGEGRGPETWATRRYVGFEIRAEVLMAFWKRGWSEAAAPGTGALRDFGNTRSIIARRSVRLIHHRPLGRGPAVNKLGRPVETPLILRALFIHIMVNKSGVAVNKLCISIRCWIHN